MSETTFEIPLLAGESYLDAAIRLSKPHGHDDDVTRHNFATLLEAGCTPEEAALWLLLEYDILPLRQEGVT